jgi:hypothetical protein
MIHAWADPTFEFIAREAADDQRRAAVLSRTDGRALDGFGIWVSPGEQAGRKEAADRRAPNREARRRRLQIARWWRQARREWEAEVAECRRRACGEFAVALSAGTTPGMPRDSGGGPKGVARLLVRAVNMRPRSERGEAQNGVQIAFEFEAGEERQEDAAARRPGDGFAETFGWPSRSHRDGGTFAGLRLARLGLATGVIGPEARGSVVPVNWPEMVGRRLLAAVRRETLAGDEGELVVARIDGLKIWSLAGGQT